MRKQRRSGHFERVVAGGEQVEAFVPAPLPPNPPLKMDGALAEGIRESEQSLERLELAGEMVPSVDWFVYAFVRKEAVLSSQIEGTQATLMDLFQVESLGTENANADVEEICNYLDALSFAQSQLSDPSGLPLSTRLLNACHQRLMAGARGKNASPGEIRRSQNWIGGSSPGRATFVPPPPNRVADLLSNLEAFMHAEDDMSPVVRAGLLHAQFETIHPYLDGNGRIGRLLIALVLQARGVLSRPLLYVSHYLKRNRLEYYDRLNAVRNNGDWEGWMRFFIEGVRWVADEAVSAARELASIVAEDRRDLLGVAATSVVAVRVFESLPQNPVMTVARAVSIANVTKPTAGRAIETLVAAGMLVETTGKRRDRMWAYDRYLQRLKIGTELAADQAIEG